MTTVCGIDPGISGALAFLHESPATLVDVVDMPTTPRVHGKGQQVDAHALSRLLVEQHVACVYVERVSAMPGQGVTSMFHFGESVGIIEGVCAARMIPMIWVTPQRWKKHFGLFKRGKDAALTVARERWPGTASTLFSRKKDVGRADAALIGLFGVGDPGRRVYPES